MAIVIPASDNKKFIERRDAVLKVVRTHMKDLRGRAREVQDWLNTEHSLEVVERDEAEESRLAEELLDGQPYLPEKWTTPAVSSRATVREDPRAARLRHAMSYLHGKCLGSQHGPLLTLNQPAATLKRNAIRAVIAGSVILDPDADEHFGDVCDLAHCPWESGRGRVHRTWGGSALDLIEAAINVLGWQGTSSGQKEVVRAERALRREVAALLRSAGQELQQFATDLPAALKKEEDLYVQPASEDAREVIAARGHGEDVIDHLGKAVEHIDGTLRLLGFQLRGLPLGPSTMAEWATATHQDWSAPEARRQLCQEVLNAGQGVESRLGEYRRSVSQEPFRGRLVVPVEAERWALAMRKSLLHIAQRLSPRRRRHSPSPPVPIDPLSIKRPVPIADAAGQYDKRSDHLANRLTRRGYPIQGIGRARAADLEHIIAAMEFKHAAKLRQWADKHHPAS